MHTEAASVRIITTGINGVLSPVAGESMPGLIVGSLEVCSEDCSEGCSEDCSEDCSEGSSETPVALIVSHQLCQLVIKLSAAVNILIVLSDILIIA